jgi:hypothetical protein
MVIASLTGCVSGPPKADQPLLTGQELISIENDTGPFCGRCDSVKVTARSDGHVWIEHGYWAGHYRDWTVERRVEQTSPANFERLRDRLRPYRPNGNLELQSKPPCETFWNDVDGVRVEWRDSLRDDKLIFNFGCDPDARRAMADALRGAPAALEIPSLKMPWGQWVATTPS